MKYKDVVRELEFKACDSAAPTLFKKVRLDFLRAEKLRLQTIIKEIFRQVRKHGRPGPSALLTYYTAELRRVKKELVELEGSP